MAFSKIQPSFAAGELSPSLFARVDLEKYHVGAALLRNFLVDYRGGASNRAGTQFINDVTLAGNGSAPRAIPFTVATTAAYVIVLGNLIAQFYSNGVYLSGSDIATPYAIADVPLVKFVQSADVLTLTHPSYAPQNITQTGLLTFTITPVVEGPGIDPPSTLAGTPTLSKHNDGIYSYVVTAVSSGQTSEESAPCARVDVLSDLPGHSDEDSGIIPSVWLNWNAPSQAVAYYNIYRAGPTNSAGNPNRPSPVQTVFGYVGQAVGTTYFDFTDTPDFSRTPPQLQNPFAPGQIAQVTVTSGGSGYTGYTVPLVFTGGGGSGAEGYAVIDPDGAVVVAVVITNFGSGYSTAPTVSDSGANTATYSCAIGQTSGTYPGVVTYVQQRRTFGGTENFPESLVMSQPGRYANFDTSPVSAASDGITLSIASKQDNSIKGMIPMSTGLVVFTTGGAFLVNGGSQQAAITPSNVVAYPQASSGANDLPPLQVNYDILYCQNRGATVRDLAFNFYVQNYTGTDRSVLASHLFVTYSLLEWTYAEEPFRQILVVRNDGAILAFTYVPEQEVFAWTRYDTNGLFVSVTSIPEGQTNAVYVIVKRFQGGSWRYFLERFDTRLFKIVEDAWFVDAGLALPQTYPAASLTLSAQIAPDPLRMNAVGDTLVATASAGVFSAPQVGDTLWAGGGKATVLGYVSATELTVEVLEPFPVLPNDPLFTPLPFAVGEWSLDTPVSSVGGLDHLNGLYAVALADGMPVTPQIVQGGSIALPQPATKVVAGLPYTAQLQTLRLDLGEPTVQGKRKNIPAVVGIYNNTLGLKVGPDFASLIEIKDLRAPYTPPIRMVSDEVRTVIPSVWKVDGQLCWQQDAPLPCTILGVVPEVVVGDTQR